MMFDILEAGLFYETGPSVYGHQDLGVGPGGAMDRFSYECGNALLGNPDMAPALEIILPPRLRFGREMFFVLTGAAYRGVQLRGNRVRGVNHGQVYRASKGEILEFGEKRYGFRTYLCYKSLDQGDDTGPEGRIRGDFHTVASWPDKTGCIRVVRGPEWSVLKNPEACFNQMFTILPDSNAMGLRLKGQNAHLDSGRTGNMISEAVSDGTVQLTPGGPVVLLRQRQTLGGYPRIINVITADLDILAQYAPGERLRFKAVSHQEAIEILRQWTHDRNAIRARYGAAANIKKGR